MGVCQDCLVTIDGSPNLNACMTVVDRPMTVARQVFPPTLHTPVEPAHPGHPDALPDPDILVVGAGAGGLAAAAVAAEAGARVLVLDERSKPGGQYFKQPGPGLDSRPGTPDDGQFAAGRRLIARARAAGAGFLRAAAVGFDPGLGLLAATESGAVVRLKPKRLIVATGAYERPHPVPGWTLPGVMTTGALQTLLRTDRVLPGRRILVAGNGPLNLQVALELASAGAEVVGVAEAAQPPAVRQFGAFAGMALSSPLLLGRGGATVLGLRRLGVPVLWGSVVTRVDTVPGGLSVTLAGPGGAIKNVTADVVGLGYGFLPACELIRLLGCPQTYDAGRDQLVTARDADMHAGRPEIFAVGDCCGLGGAPAAMAEGIIAGAVAATETGAVLPQRLVGEVAAARRSLGRHRRFQTALWRLFAAPRPNLKDVPPDTVLCRCEEVTRESIEQAIDAGVSDIGSLKRATRLGMGRCQGRYCGPLAVRLLAENGKADLDASAFFAPRPPVRPVRLGALAGLVDNDEIIHAEQGEQVTPRA
jgi:NADPH-dependent 2,4-dienoyl-CoA reductase/sulfur reductase-like enzyme